MELKNLYRFMTPREHSIIDDDDLCPDLYEMSGGDDALFNMLGEYWQYTYPFRTGARSDQPLDFMGFCSFKMDCWFDRLEDLGYGI